MVDSSRAAVSGSGETRDDLAPRPNGLPHLSECLALTAYEMGWDDPEQYECTCDDFSPDGGS